MEIQGLILNPETKIAAQILAEKTFERYRNTFGHYRNTANSHLVGHLGEFAAFIWLRDNGFQPIAHFSDPSQDRNCDIETNVGRLEVKTWSAKYWEQWGRAVSVSQYASIKKKADFLFFCTVDQVESETPLVSFKGWCEVSAVENLTPKLTGNVGRQVNNYQLEESDLKNIKSLRGKNESKRNP